MLLPKPNSGKGVGAAPVIIVTWCGKVGISLVPQPGKSISSYPVLA